MLILIPRIRLSSTLLEHMTEHFSGGSDKTIGKLIILEEYLDVYTTIMKKRWDGELWYVDTHAGTGRTRIDNYDITVDGSTIRAIDQYGDAFDGFYFYEINSDHFTTLHETLEARFNAIQFDVYPKQPDNGESFDVAYCDEPRVVIMQKDSNQGARWLAEQSKDYRHWFTFVDPKGLTAKKETLDKLIEREYIDILITYQTTGVLRSAAEGADHAYSAVTRTIGDNDWPHAGSPDEYVQLYKEKLEENPDFETVSKPMLSERDKRNRFDLVFASKNQTARGIMKDDIMEQDNLPDKITEEIEEAREYEEQSGLGDFT